MKLGPDDISALITFLVGGSAATLVTQVLRGASSLRKGARASTREVVKDLAEARDETEDRLKVMTRDMEYWRSVAGGYIFQMARAGLAPQPAEPSPPSAAVIRRRHRNLDPDDSGEFERPAR